MGFLTTLPPKESFKTQQHWSVHPKGLQIPCDKRAFRCSLSTGNTPRRRGRKTASLARSSNSLVPARFENQEKSRPLDLASEALFDSKSQLTLALALFLDYLQNLLSLATFSSQLSPLEGAVSLCSLTHAPSDHLVSAWGHSHLHILELPAGLLSSSA